MPINSTTIRAHLQQDKILQCILHHRTEYTIAPKKNLFRFICHSIISQQLNTRVAAVLIERFEQVIGHKNTRPEYLLNVDDDDLRKIGLSASKVTYLKAVARYFTDTRMTDARLYRMDDQDVIDTLVQIKGIGRWTAQMVLVFGMGRPDVFAPDDLVIRQAMIDLYKLPTLSGKALTEQLETIAENWQPYRSYAMLHLWATRG
ncbi:MAG: DNA-3-methyladenine glycosylase family protein [Ferruginibacter sp.]